MCSVADQMPVDRVRKPVPARALKVGPLYNCQRDAGWMDGIQIGYARVSTTDQDLTAQREALLRLGVADAQIYVDHGMTGANRARPGLREALAAVRSGDTLVVTKLDRLARSLRDARDIADELTAKGVALSLGGSRYDPTDPVGRLLFNVLGMVAEFERDLISMRTREGMAVARAKGKLKGKQPKLSKTQRALLFELQDRGEYTQTDIAELLSVSRATIYREIRRRRASFLASCEAHIY
ncbi:hypothetical protein GCM10009776_36600 [Microbacterium deminutum]|uniref:Resolvase/invertase-type recombinase catalytic domain-containing protein n=2 Tax=Microbacterium deminutum TaxID=344164 RepID=A0ABP5CYN7_9MICO